MATGRRGSSGIVAVLLAAALAVPAGANEGESPSDAPAATLSEAKAYWTGSLIASALATLILMYLVRKYNFDPVFQDPTVRVFIPLFTGNAMFSWSYCIHHAFNLVAGEAHYWGDGIENTGWWCDVTVPGSFGLVVQFFGFVLVAWAPLHMIRRAKELKPVEVSRKLLVGTVLGGVAASVAALGVGAALAGSFRWKMPFMKLFCTTSMWGSWERFLPFVLALNVPMGVVVYFYIRAEVELKSLGMAANSSHLRAEAATLRNYGILSILNTFFWNSPVVLLMVLDTSGVRMPTPFIMIAGWLLKYNAMGDFVIIMLHVRGLKKKRRNRQARSLKTTFRKGAGSGVDTKALPNRGVSIHFLCDFAERHGVDGTMTIGDVMTKIVMQETRAEKCPFVDTITDLVDEAGRPAVDRPRFFVSHCWADSFLVLLEQLMAFYYQQGELGTLYFWVDIFAINQHDVTSATELPVMHTVIQSAEAVVLTLNPWSAPKTLTRVWCLWELLKAVQHDTQICPVMPNSEADDFMATIQVDHRRIAEVLAKVDAQNASATNEGDKVTIFKEISETVGFDGLNDMVKKRLGICLQGVAVDRMISGVGAEKTPSGRKSAAGGELSKEACPA